MSQVCVPAPCPVLVVGISSWRKVECLDIPVNDGFEVIALVVIARSVEFVHTILIVGPGLGASVFSTFRPVPLVEFLGSFKLTLDAAAVHIELHRTRLGSRMIVSRNGSRINRVFFAILHTFNEDIPSGGALIVRFGPRDVGCAIFDVILEKQLDTLHLSVELLPTIPAEKIIEGRRVRRGKMHRARRRGGFDDL